MTAKTCTICGDDKPTSDFRVIHGRWIEGYCKECHLAKRRVQYANAREHRTAIRRDAYAVNAGGYKDKAAARNKARYEKLGRASIKEWMDQNPDRVREVGRAKMARYRESLSDSYVKKLIVQHNDTLNSGDIPPSLIEAKRVQIQIMRLVNEKCT